MSSSNFPKLPTFIRRLRVNNDIMGKKRVPYRKLAVKYDVSRRTITDDVKWIKSNLNLLHMQKSVSEKVLQALEDEKEPRVILQYGLTFLGRGIVQQITTKEEVEIKQELTFNFNELPEDERNLLEHAVRVYLKGRSETKPSSVR